ncbi:MAG: energy transducer TonB [Methyloprofundus sp.]|nr:energy transducer TonB [Methyloprofundus sp.]MBW6453337.1 energy transducer TonB [Methyloprofundus sp.]
MIRITFSLFSGIIIALALFWGMQYMVMNHQQRFKKTDNVHMTEFVRLKQESKMQTKERQIPNKPKPKERPAQPKMQAYNTQVSKVAAPEMDIPNLDIPLQASNFSGSVLSGQNIKMGAGAISTSVIPLVRIPPEYPMRAANRRIEGWVKIEFTINTQGEVEDAVVIDAKPNSIFNSAALKAIKRWKFKPLIIAGEAQEQRAVQILEFKLSR